MEEFETTNINLKWLDNIYNQLKILQDLERMAREGCVSLLDFIQIPLNIQNVIIPEVRYKNMKFFALELDILINNLVPVLEGDVKKHKERLDKIIKIYDTRNLFLEEVKSNNNFYIKVKPFLTKTIDLLVKIKSEIIKDIGHILFIKEDNKNKW